MHIFSSDRDNFAPNTSRHNRDSSYDSCYNSELVQLGFRSRVVKPPLTHQWIRYQGLGG